MLKKLFRLIPFSLMSLFLTIESSLATPNIVDISNSDKCKKGDDRWYQQVAIAAGANGNKYDIAMVSVLCEGGNIEDVQENVQFLVDRGKVSPSDARTIANYMNVEIELEPRSMEGRLYEVTNAILNKYCSTATAGTLASLYVEQPNSVRGRLVEQVLTRDLRKLPELKGCSEKF